MSDISDLGNQELNQVLKSKDGELTDEAKKTLDRAFNNMKGNCYTDGSRQAERDVLKNSVLQKCDIPLVRLRTNESGEENRIVEKLQAAVLQPI